MAQLINACGPCAPPCQIPVPVPVPVIQISDENYLYLETNLLI